MLAWMGGARRKLKAAQNRGMGRHPAVGVATPGHLGGPWLQHTSSHPSTPPRKRKALSAGGLHELEQLSLHGMSMHGVMHPPIMVQTNHPVDTLMCEWDAGTAAFQRLTDQAARNGQSPEAVKRLKQDASKVAGAPMVGCT